MDKIDMVEWPIFTTSTDGGLLQNIKGVYVYGVFDPTDKTLISSSGAVVWSTIEDAINLRQKLIRLDKNGAKTLQLVRLKLSQLEIL